MCVACMTRSTDDCKLRGSPHPTTGCTARTSTPSIVIGVLLVLAASLKGYWGVVGDPVDDMLPQWLVAGLVYFELFLGIWLLTGRCERLGCIVAFSAFGVFACFSLTAILAGQKSCGCF